MTKASTVPAPPKVVGLDGKTYTRPEPKTQSDRRAAPPPWSSPPAGTSPRPSTARNTYHHNTTRT